jgi:hypothetical protein
LILMRGQWGRAAETAPTGFREILSDSVTRRLLLIALMNAAPVAVSSTVFLFFVGSVLDAEGWEGAASDPLFPRRRGDDPDLVPARGAIRGTARAAGGHGAGDRDLFGCPDAQAGDVGLFAAICFVSGARSARISRSCPRFSPGAWRTSRPRRGGLRALGLRAEGGAGAGGRDDAAGARRGRILRGGGTRKLGRGVATPDMALCFGALHPETRGDGASGDHAPARLRNRPRPETRKTHA